MPSKLKRVVMYLGDVHYAILKERSRRTGVPIAEIMRRLILPPLTPQELKYTPDQETR